MSSALSVFFDFDGTVTTTDTGVHLLERLATADWRIEEERYESGQIGSRECLQRQWDLLPHDEGRLRATAREVEVDAGFAPLVAALKRAGAEVTVVSDGFGFYAEEVCAAHGVEVMTNVVDWSSGQLTFPHLDRCCPCTTCGTCKQAPIKDARRRGRRTVFVGDGISDRKAALLADVLLAKDDLARWCEELGVDHRRFESLGDVARILDVSLGAVGGPS